MRSANRQRPVILGLLWMVAGVAAVAAPADRPDNTTCAFFGPDWEWPGIQLVIQDGSPLFGLREYFVAGDGSVTVVDVIPDADSGAEEKRYELSGAGGRVRQLIEQLCRGDVLAETPGVADAPPPTCSGPPRLYVRNAVGQARSVAFPRDDRSVEYEGAWLAAASLKELLVGATPVHEAPHAPGFVPAAFEDWARALVLPRRPTRFSRPPSDEQRRRALEEYQRAEEIQRRRVLEEQR